MRQKRAVSYLESSDTDVVSHSETEYSSSEQAKINDEKTQPIHAVASKQKADLKCGHCDMLFVRQDALDRHEFKHTNFKKYPCTAEPPCERRYSNRAHLRRHLQTAHRDLSDKGETLPKTKCQDTTCSRMFANKYAMRKHFKVTHLGIIRFRCHHCDETFKRKTHLKTHMYVHTNQFPYKCHQCGAGFLNQRLARHHSITHRAYQCQECEEKFPKWSALQVHRRSHWTKIECTVCGKTFANRTNLRTHTRIHSDDDKRIVYPCTYENCTKFYLYKNGLKVHIRRQHVRGPNRIEFECHYCGVKLSTKRSITHHLLKFHQNANGKSVVQQKTIRKKSMGERKRRFGQNKVSLASQLTGVRTTAEMEKLIRSGKGKNIELIYLPPNEDNDNDVTVDEVVALAVIKSK